MIPAFIIFGSNPTSNGLLWGALSGACVAVGLTALFGALALSMPIGASVTGIVTIAVPVVFGLATGERPELVALIGLVIGVAALPLIVFDPEKVEAELDRARGSASSRLATMRRLGVIHAVAAGLGLGASSITLSRTTDADGMWVILGSQVSTLVVLTLVALVLRKPLLPQRGARLHAAAVGPIHLAGVVSLVLALQRGLLTLVAVVQSLYPAFTIILARIVLDERLARRQIAGLVLAGIGVTLIGIS
jgi:drug/metabolite transporter (DMT)-like permease